MNETGRARGWPSPADFAAPPGRLEREDWEAADRTARPARLARLRARFAAAGIDAYFGVRREHMRYLTGFTLAEGEEKVAGQSGQFLVSAEGLVVLADSRYTIQARREAPEAQIVGRLQRPAGAVAGAARVGRGAPDRRRSRVRLASHLESPRGRGSGRRSRAG